MSKINALLLASNIQPLWGYDHTDQNSADKPSRWHRRVRSKFRHALSCSRLLEAQKPEDRAKQRQKLGTLRELTVQPTTRARYNVATDAFLNFLKAEKLELPGNKKDMDPLVCDYLKHLWASGAGHALASDTLAGLQDLQPDLRSRLPGAANILGTIHHASNWGTHGITVIPYDFHIGAPTSAHFIGPHQGG